MRSKVSELEQAPNVAPEDVAKLDQVVLHLAA
jgi:hypothetical protein